MNSNFDNRSASNNNNNNFLFRAILYSGIGLLFKLKGRNVAALAVLGPAVENILGFTPEQVLQAYLTELQQQEEKKRMERIQQEYLQAFMKPISLEVKSATENAYRKSTSQIFWRNIPSSREPAHLRPCS